jgi:hypothetical protein
MGFNFNYCGLYRFERKKVGVLHLNSMVLKILLRPPSCAYVSLSVGPFPKPGTVYYQTSIPNQYGACPSVPIVHEHV